MGKVKCLVMVIVLQKTVPCEVASLAVLLKSMMMSGVMVACMGAEVCPEVVTAARCRGNRGPVSVVCGYWVPVFRSNRS